MNKAGTRLPSYRVRIHRDNGRLQACIRQVDRKRGTCREILLGTLTDERIFNPNAFFLALDHETQKKLIWPNRWQPDLSAAPDEVVPQRAGALKSGPSAYQTFRIGLTSPESGSNTELVSEDKSRINVALFAFSDRGTALAEHLRSLFETAWQAAVYRPKGNLTELTEQLFPVCDALIFIGACGIAVRAIAPHVKSKAEDPAVLVLDEAGTFVIPVLSGHIGGANDLARRISGASGALPVITTATDVSRRFSADAWAAKYGLEINSLKAAKRFSAGILTQDMPVLSDFPLPPALPAGLKAVSEAETSSFPCGLFLSCSTEAPFEETLQIIPRLLHLGIGCRRSTSAEALDEAVRQVLREAGLSASALKSVASIDLKQDEAGLLAFARKRQLPVSFYSAETLAGVPGSFTASSFVLAQTGVDNVCERAALCAAGSGSKLLVRKTCFKGITVAVATQEWRVCFE